MTTIRALFIATCWETTLAMRNSGASNHTHLQQRKEPEIYHRYDVSPPTFHIYSVHTPTMVDLLPARRYACSGCDQ